MHKMDSRNDFCEDCGVTGLELLQEPRLAAQCDYDLVQEYRTLTYEYNDAMAALFVPAGQLYPEFKREEPVAVDKVTPVKELTVLEAWRQMNDAKDPVIDWSNIRIDHTPHPYWKNQNWKNQTNNTIDSDTHGKDIAKALKHG